jgi:short-subunit dehydrogenase
MSEKVVLITGASSGIGKALAFRYAQAGYRISICARNEAKLKTIATEIRQKYKNEVFYMPADVAQESDCKQWVEASVQYFGQIHLLINNAGISMRASFADLDLTVLKQLMDINFWGMVYCTKYALPYLIQTKGTIVGVSSIAGYRGLPERTGYSASKFAMNGFLESLRTELLPTGVHVLTACPGFTRSNIRQTALVADGTVQGESPRDEQSMMSAEAVADAIFKAVEQKKKTLILTRLGKMTVFLNKFFNGWMDKKVYANFQKEKRSEKKTG